MGNLCFLTDSDLPNYLDNSAYYKFRNPPLSFSGKYIHSNYVYWILKNYGVKNVKILKSDEDIRPGDILLFHYNYVDKIDFKKDYVKLQIVSDKPRIENIDGYCCYDPTDLKENEYLLYDPLPVGLSTKSAQYKPTRFHCNTAIHWLPDYLKCTKKYTSKNINISFEHNRHFSFSDFDIFFFLRNTACLSELNDDGTKKHNIILYKNATRLFQAWHMEVPSIFSAHSAMSYVRKSELDYLEANTEEEFISCCERLQNDKSLFYGMIENAKIRKKEFTNETMINQIDSILKAFNSSLQYQ